MRSIIFDEYRKAMAAVSRHYGLDEAPLLHSNKVECVDARATLVSILIEHDLTEAALVQLTGLTQQCMNKLKNSVRFREKGWTFRETMKAVRKELETN